MTTPGLSRARPLAAKLPPAYSLAHEADRAQSLRAARKTAAAHFVAAPIYFVRPQKGTLRTVVACPTCQQKVTVLVRSPVAVKWERLKRLSYILLILLAFYAFVALIPWTRLLGSNDTCVGLLALFGFGGVALYNGARVIAPEAVLQVDIAGKPFRDILPSFGRRGSHTILRRK